MGIVSTVLSNDGKDVKVDRGSGDNVTAQKFAPSGDDSPPLPKDYCALSSAAGAGRQTAIGYYDPKNKGVASPGEKRIYSRSPDGAVASVFWLKGDKTIHVTNGAGAIEMLADGTILLNGMRIPPDGTDIFSTNGRSLMKHKHPQAADSAGNTEADTGDTIA